MSSINEYKKFLSNFNISEYKPKAEKILLITTTFNQIDYSKDFIISLLKTNFLLYENHHCLIIDDNSIDGTKEFLDELEIKYKNIKIFKKDKQRGLTDSWNIGYKFFKENNYDKCIISNNDVILNNTIYTFIKNIDNCLIGPLTNLGGVYGSGYKQIIDNNIINKKPYKVNLVNGFFFGFDRNIIKYEYKSNQLFNPAYLMVGNEDELCNRLKKNNFNLLIDTETFIYHFKARSFSGFVKDRQCLRTYDKCEYNNFIFEDEFNKLYSNLDESLKEEYYERWRYEIIFG